jgi:hypothetical protein
VVRTTLLDGHGDRSVKVVMTMSSTAGVPVGHRVPPPAGWYDDPEIPGQKRFWDGSRWTDERVPAPPVAPPVAAEPEPVPEPEPEPGPAAMVEPEPEPGPGPEAMVEPVPVCGGERGPEGVSDRIYEGAAFRSPVDTPAATSFWAQKRGPFRTWMWTLAGVVVLVGMVVGVLLVRTGGQGVAPVPGTYSGTGTNGFDISFTVTSFTMEVDSVSVQVETIAGRTRGNAVSGPWPIENGRFEVRLNAPLGLETITIEGRFVDDGRQATGSYTVELGSGVEVKSGESVGSSGTWTATIEP